jgi:spore maturation protein CgeB
MMQAKPPHASLKLALITDNLTHECLAHECRVMSVTPWNWRAVFRFWKPDILFVESTWRGRWDAWRYRIASYPDVPERNNRLLARVVQGARDAHIPAVFWNREDGVHFDRFIGSACLFDRVLTVDEAMIPRYREQLAPGARVDVMMFAAQPAIHAPADIEPERRAAFVGSYSRQVHPERRVWQDAMFDAAEAIGLAVYDRNSSRRPDHYRFPDHPWIEVRKAISHARTAEVYRTHAVNLNVNTIADSPTAFSRRLVEILASGGFALTNPTPAVTRLFADYCAVTDDAGEARELFARVAREGLSTREREQARAGVDYVRSHHSWRHRIDQIMEMAA